MGCELNQGLLAGSGSVPLPGCTLQADDGRDLATAARSAPDGCRHHQHTAVALGRASITRRTACSRPAVADEIGPTAWSDRVTNASGGRELGVKGGLL
jgi:hypothetical protein